MIRFPGVVIDPTAHVAEDVTIGPNTTIGRHVIIEAGVDIAQDCVIEDFTILGYGQLTHARHDVGSRLEIFPHVRIRTHCVIYRGCQIGAHSLINHHVGLREETIIGEETSIGSHVWCEGYTRIGNRTTIHAQCHLTARMTIEDYVFIGPQITTANARQITHRRSALVDDRVEQGPTIRFGARIGSAVMILPGITIGREALVAAGSNVTKDVPDYMIAVGNPAKVVKEIRDAERLRPGIDFPNQPIASEEGQ